MNILVEKLLLALCIILVTLVFVFLPLGFTKVPKHWESRLLSLCNAFAGGVFLAGGFVHLLTETGEMIEKSGLDIPDLPYPAFFCLTGFLVVFFIEQVILSSHSHSHHGETEIKESTPNSQQMKDLASDQVDNSTSGSKEQRDEVQVIEESKEQPEIIQDTVTAPESRTLQIMGLILVIVLSVHSLVAGFSMGMQTDSELVITMFVTIISHKWVESFALGSNLLRSGVSKRNILIIGTAYSLAVPLGVVVGTVIQEFLTGIYAVIGTIVATGIGAGTFIYVAIVDIMLVEFKNPQDKYPKMGLVLAGLVTLSVLLIFFDKD
jgi:zinc transporter ZupT